RLVQGQQPRRRGDTDPARRRPDHRSGAQQILGSARCAGLHRQPDSGAAGRPGPVAGWSPMSWVRRHRMLVSNIALVIALLIGASYLLVDVMRVNPLRSTYAVTVDLDQSGGLQSGNDVTLRGFRVGKVDSITLADGGAAIRARVSIDSRYRIPSD